MTTNVWLEQEWHDERLTWNKSKYNNMDKIRIPCNRIWLPDIVLYNSADDYINGYMQSKAMVTSDGLVFWPPPAKLRSSCKIDVTFFPFDDQLCIIKFGSWTYSGIQVDLINKSFTTDLTSYVQSGEWNLISVRVERNTVYYPCCSNEPYPDIVFYIHIRRRILYFLINIILPCIWLSILSLLGFWLPPESGEKITLGITVLLAFSVFMVMIAENIPATSETVPLIGIYLTITMALTSMSIILTVFVLQLHHVSQIPPKISPCMYNLLTKKVAVFMGMSDLVKRHEAMIKRKKISDFNSSINKKIRRICKGSLAETEFLYRNARDNHSPSTINKSQTNEYFNNRERDTSTTYKYTPSPICHHSKKYNYQLLNEQKTETTNKRSNHGIYEYINLNKLSNQRSNSHATIKKATSSTNTSKKTLKNLSIGYETLSNKHDDMSKSGHHHYQHLQIDDERIRLQYEWKLIALIVDRILFWIFSTITLVSSILILVVIPVLKNRNLIQSITQNG